MNKSMMYWLWTACIMIGPSLVACRSRPASSSGVSILPVGRDVKDPQPMTIGLARYLGRDIGELLRSEPFSGWSVARSVESDPKPEVRYEFDGYGFEVICDGFDRIETLFLHRGGDGASLVDIPFTMGRSQVLGRFGTPEKSGGPVHLSVLGDQGAWDRFAFPEGVLHIQYSVGRDEIALITLMRTDVVP